MTGAACPRCGLRIRSGRLALCPRCLLDDTTPADALPGGLPAAPPGLVLEAQIGRGGMGRVFRARHVRLDREVAVKLLPPELAADPAFEARFAREARAMARLSHPHVVGVHDFGITETGESYLVMELLPGGTLAARLPLPTAEAARVAGEVLQGLAYAHGKGLVHRDIKPENVLFDAEGRAKIADFGIARLAEAGSTLTHAHVVLGTPAYMAPEARAGAPPDPRMDVFAVGVLVHQMLTGAPPDGTPAALAALPPALAALVRRATATDPRDRWASATEMLAALTAAAPDLGGAAAGAGPGARPSADAARARAAALELPPEEQSWLRAVALVLAGATAVALYAFLVSVTPRTLDPGDALPFVTFGPEVRPDGRVFTRARFETWPTLAAAGAFALSLAAYGLLRRHWRSAGLDLPAPDRPLPATRAVLTIAIINIGLAALRVLAERAGVRAVWAYIPVAGGVLELAMVYFVWLAVLEARRTGRLLRREPLLWASAALSLVPPVVSFVRLMAGKPP